MTAKLLRLRVVKNKNLSEASRLSPDLAGLSLKTSSGTKIQPPAKCITKILFNAGIGERVKRETKSVAHFSHKKCSIFL